MARTTMPTKKPKAWKATRTKWTWGMFALAIIPESLLQWLAQIVAGGIVGAFVGVSGLANITASDFDQINAVTIWSAVIITLIVAGVVARRAYTDLTWFPSMGQFEYGMDWWPSFWLPLLVGAAIHGVLFGFFMAAYAGSA